MSEVKQQHLKTTTTPSTITAVLHINTAQQHQLECGPMLNVMAALPNVTGALFSMPQSLADAHY